MVNNSPNSIVLKAFCIYTHLVSLDGDCYLKVLVQALFPPKQTTCRSQVVPSTPTFKYTAFPSSRFVFKNHFQGIWISLLSDTAVFRISSLHICNRTNRKHGLPYFQKFNKDLRKLDQ